jgi:hypothetical protein
VLALTALDLEVPHHLETCDWSGSVLVRVILVVAKGPADRGYPCMTVRARDPDED